jgi:hypothetical protein
MRIVDLVARSRVLRISAVTMVGVGLVMGGCGRPRLPSRVDVRSWRQLTTNHFILRTDLDAPEAREAVESLETSRDCIVSAAWPGVQIPETERVHVIALASTGQFERVLGPGVAGIFSSVAIPTFIVAGSPSHWEQGPQILGARGSTLRHELAHQLSAAMMPARPGWFTEGFAQFLETVHPSDDGTAVVVGGTELSAFQGYLQNRQVRLRRLLAWTGWSDSRDERERWGLYGHAWVFVHWLFDTKPAAFARYQSELASGTDFRRAFALAFPGFDPDTAEPEVDAYAHGTPFGEVLRPLVRTKIDIDERPMTEAEVRVARARVALTASHHLEGKEKKLLAEECQREATAAMELNPTIVEVLLFATWLPDEERLALVRSAAFEHPRDGRIFALLADLTNEANERETAFRNALELRPKDVAILKAFVDFLLASHREDEAAPWLKTALERAPNDLRLNELNALFEERTGHCARAIRDYRAAAGLAEDDVSRSVRRRLFMHLAELVATCPAGDR